MKIFIENLVNVFLIYDNNKKHCTIRVAPFRVMKNFNDEQRNLKAK